MESHPQQHDARDLYAPHGPGGTPVLELGPSAGRGACSNNVEIVEGDLFPGQLSTEAWVVFVAAIP